MQKFRSKRDDQSGTRHGRGHTACGCVLFFYGKAQFAATLWFFTMTFRILWVLNSFWGLRCPSEKFEPILTCFHFFLFSQFSSVKNIKKILAGPESKSTENSSILTFFSTTVQKFGSKRDDVVRAMSMGTRRILNKYMKAQNWTIYIWWILYQCSRLSLFTQYVPEKDLKQSSF